jgi:hypothetical protein
MVKDAAKEKAELLLALGRLAQTWQDEAEALRSHADDVGYDGKDTSRARAAIRSREMFRLARELEITLAAHRD